MIWQESLGEKMEVVILGGIDITGVNPTVMTGWPDTPGWSRTPVFMLKTDECGGDVRKAIAAHAKKLAGSEAGDVLDHHKALEQKED